jgi:hypothetical protein
VRAALGRGNWRSLAFRQCGAYALAEIGNREVVDVFLRGEDAFAALEDAVRTSATGAGLLSVARIELDDRELSPN